MDHYCARPRPRAAAAALPRRRRAPLLPCFTGAGRLIATHGAAVCKPTGRVLVRDAFHLDTAGCCCLCRCCISMGGRRPTPGNVIPRGCRVGSARPGRRRRGAPRSEPQAAARRAAARVWVLNRAGLLTCTRGPAGVWVLNRVGLLTCTRGPAGVWVPNRVGLLTCTRGPAGVWVPNRAGLLTCTRGPAGVWVLNCVGLLNHKAFLLFLAYTRRRAWPPACWPARSSASSAAWRPARRTPPGAPSACSLKGPAGSAARRPCVGRRRLGPSLEETGGDRRPGGHHVAASQSRTTSGDLSPLSRVFCVRGVHAARPWLAQRERARCRPAKRVAKAASGGARGCTQAREPRPEALLGLARKGRVTALLLPRPRRRCRFPRAGRRSCLWRS